MGGRLIQVDASCTTVSSRVKISSSLAGDRIVVGHGKSVMILYARRQGISKDGASSTLWPVIKVKRTYHAFIAQKFACDARSRARAELLDAVESTRPPSLAASISMNLSS